MSHIDTYLRCHSEEFSHPETSFSNNPLISFFALKMSEKAKSIAAYSRNGCASYEPFSCRVNNRCGNGMLYIWETGRPLRAKFGEHRRAVTSNDANEPVGRHFNNIGHCVSDLKIRAQLYPVFYSNYNHKRHGMRLTSKLGNVHPPGLNERFSFISCSPFFGAVDMSRTGPTFNEISPHIWFRYIFKIAFSWKRASPAWRSPAWTKRD